jgi:hypothetical protein
MREPRSKEFLVILEFSEYCNRKRFKLSDGTEKSSGRPEPLIVLGSVNRTIYTVANDSRMITV